MSKLNLFLTKNKFKQKGIESALTLITPGSYLASIDIESSFSLLNLDVNSRKFTCFKWRHRWFMFKCLCQGASVSPASFVTVCRPIAKFLRKRLLSIFLFVDDSLLVARTTKILKGNLQLTIDTFERAGFLINYKKSHLVPSQIMEFLGFIINTVEFSIDLTVEKRKKFMTWYQVFCDTLTVK